MWSKTLVSEYGRTILAEGEEMPTSEEERFSRLLGRTDVSVDAYYTDGKTIVSISDDASNIIIYALSRKLTKGEAIKAFKNKLASAIDDLTRYDQMIVWNSFVEGNPLYDEVIYQMSISGFNKAFNTPGEAVSAIYKYERYTGNFDFDANYFTLNSNNVIEPCYSVMTVEDMHTVAEWLLDKNFDCGIPTIREVLGEYTRIVA